MIFNEKNEYLYKSIKLTPQVIVEIIVYLYRNNNEIHERKQLIDNIVKFHNNNGGVNSDTNIAQSVKKALQSISSDYIKNKAYGCWQFFIDDKLSYEKIYKPKTNKNIEKKVGNLGKDKLNIKNGWVYFYYFSTYKELSVFKKEKYFPIKIGKSQHEPQFRINDQIGTAMPEKPIIFMEVKTNDCSNLERNIHSFLALSDKKHNKSVGKEWFVSNEEDLISLINQLKGSGVELYVKLLENNN